SFVCGDVTAVPLRTESVDAVTLFDVLEHVQDDAAVLREALRVVRPGGTLLVSAPNEGWRFPYHGVMQPLCPSAAAIMADWGHVRSGYALAELDRMLSLPHVVATSFCTPWTAVSHDLAFSRLPGALRLLGCAAVAPVVWVASLFDDGRRGTETDAAWGKPVAVGGGGCGGPPGASGGGGASQPRQRSGRHGCPGNAWSPPPVHA